MFTCEWLEAQVIVVWRLLGRESNGSSKLVGAVAVYLIECGYGPKGNCIALGPNPNISIVNLHPEGGCIALSSCSIVFPDKGILVWFAVPAQR